jgi:hypothetical protein
VKVPHLVLLFAAFFYTVFTFITQIVTRLHARAFAALAVASGAAQ